MTIGTTLKFGNVISEQQKVSIDDFWELTVPYVSKYAYEEAVVVRKKVPIGFEKYMIKAFELLKEKMDIFRSTPLQEDWGEAPDIPLFLGRQEEFEELEEWIFDGNARVIVILGIGGIGKTSLAKKLSEQIKNQFEFLFWRDLVNAPSAKDVLRDCIRLLSHQQQIELPEDVSERVLLLINFLKNSRSLIILDNVESILQGKNGRAGAFRGGYEDYRTLIQKVAEIDHKSCLILTSREKPENITLLEGKKSFVRSLQLKGLEQIDAQQLLKDNELQGSEEHWFELIKCYGGHPLALKLVARIIRELFGGDISAFFHAGSLIYSNIKDILEQQYNRLSESEREIIYWLVIAREPISVNDLHDEIIGFNSPQEAIRSLQQRSLIEAKAQKITLHPVMMEYFTERLIEQMYRSLANENTDSDDEVGSFLDKYALIQAQAKDYIRESQKSFLLAPLAEKINTTHDNIWLEKRIQKILAQLHANSPQKPGYAAANLLHLLIHQKSDLRQFDFSELSISQAYLQGVNLHDTHFVRAHFSKCVFIGTFGNITSIAYSPDGNLLAAGTMNKETLIFQVKDGTLLFVNKEHTGRVWSIDFSPDGKVLASGSEDRTIRLWNVETGECLLTLEGHSDIIRSVCFSPDGNWLASGGDDGTIKIWDRSNGKLLKELETPSQQILTVAFSPDNKMLAYNSTDKDIQLWHIGPKQSFNRDNIAHLNLYRILSGHSDVIYSLAFSPDGKQLISGSKDKTVRLWECSSGKCLYTFEGHSSGIRTIAYSPDDYTVASGSEDETIRLWDLYTRRCLKILQGHTSQVSSIAFGSNGKTLSSSGSDLGFQSTRVQSIRVWDVYTGHCIKRLYGGYTNRTLSIGFKKHGKVLASGYGDRKIRLWDIESKKCFKELHGHRNWVMSVAFSPDGTKLASGSSDHTVRLWEVDSGKSICILEGHEDQVYCVIFADDKTLFSCGSDKTIRLWNIESKKCLKILTGHEAWIRSMTLKGAKLASGSDDSSIRIWDISTGNCLESLTDIDSPVYAVSFSPDAKMLVSGYKDGAIHLWDVHSDKSEKLYNHEMPVRAVIFSPDGQYIASSSQDKTVKFWDLNTKKLHTLKGNSDWVWSLSVSSDGQILAGASEDGTICLWNILTGEQLDSLKPDRPYERMNITGATGLTEAQKATLKDLGAYEN